MTHPLTRRNMLAGLVAGVPLACQAADSAGTSPAPETEGVREVRIEHLRPREIDEAMKECPLLFLPLGTIEWHGLHNIVGLDALKAHMLCVRAAERGGGLVAPPLYGGVGGLDQPHTFVMEAEDDLFSVLLRPWLEKLCREAVRQGFRAIIVLTGHYGAGQQIVVRETAVRMSRVLQVPVLGCPEYLLALDAGYRGDHAAWGETSLMMYLDPPSVDLDRLGEEPHRGVGGKDPKRFATREDGQRLAELIIDRLAQLAGRMPFWDAATVQRFVEAESALVNHQIALAEAGKEAWAGWRNLGQGVFDDYGRLLAEQKFEDIVALVEKL